MTARRKSTSPHRPDLYTQWMSTAWFMLLWIEREQLSNLQALGFLTAPGCRPRRPSTTPANHHWKKSLTWNT